MLSYKHLEIQMARASALPLLPHVATQLLQVSDDASTGPKEFERLILQDAALTAKILRSVNSPYYGGGGRVTSIQRAILLMGPPVVRSICIMTSIQSSMASRNLKRTFDQTGYWKHSLAVACMSKVIATLKQYPRPEEAFVAGLLHDIGKLAIQLFLPDEATKLHRLAIEKQLSDYELEEEVLGLTHEQIGGQAAVRWELPPIYQEAIRRHHTLLGGDTEPSAITQYVHVANALAHRYEMGFGFSGAPNEMNGIVLSMLDLNEAQCEVVAKTVCKEVCRLMQSMALDRAA